MRWKDAKLLTLLHEKESYSYRTFREQLDRGRLANEDALMKGAFIEALLAERKGKVAVLPKCDLDRMTYTEGKEFMRLVAPALDAPRPQPPPAPKHDRYRDNAPPARQHQQQHQLQRVIQHQLQHQRQPQQQLHQRQQQQHQQQLPPAKRMSSTEHARPRAAPRPRVPWPASAKGVLLDPTSKGWQAGDFSPGSVVISRSAYMEVQRRLRQQAGWPAIPAMRLNLPPRMEPEAIRELIEQEMEDMMLAIADRSIRLQNGDIGELPGALRGTASELDEELHKAAARACLQMVPHYAAVHKELKDQDQVGTISLADASLEDMLQFLGALLVATSKGLKETFAHISDSCADVDAALKFTREPIGKALNKGEPLPLSIHATREAAPANSGNTVAVVPTETDRHGKRDGMNTWENPGRS